MTPEQYLTRLIHESPYARFVVSPDSALRKTVDTLVRAMQANWDNVPIESVPELYAPQAGSDPHLTRIRDGLLRFFPEGDRDRLASAPVGTVYNLEINGFATPTPDGDGAVVCIDNGLQTALSMTNQWVHLFSPEDIRRRNAEADVYAYAAAMFMHWIFAYTGKVIPPMPAKMQRDPKIVLAQATGATTVQLDFILAHEYSHILLGHVNYDRCKLPVETIRLHELQADESGAKVVLQNELSREVPLSRHDLELHLGAIGAIFYASDAILDILHLGSPFTRVYPSPEDRFDRVIEVFRPHYGAELMGADQYMRPFSLISHIFHLIPRNPPLAVEFLTDMARTCRRIGDNTEECFVLAVAREVARLAGGEKVVQQIHAHIVDNISADNVYGDTILGFRF